MLKGEAGEIRPMTPKVNVSGRRLARARRRRHAGSMGESGGHNRVEGEVSGNRLTLYPEGPDRLHALIRPLGGARETLRFLYYMFMDDRAGTRVRDALIAASERGVKVWLLVDGFGSTGNME